MWRYNWLIKRGYTVCSGCDYIDVYFGYKWSIVIMKKGIKLKKVRINNLSSWRDL